MRDLRVQSDYADLSQRLEHLVTYSSQLVFISGDQFKNQRSFVEAFLGAHAQQEDVVYIHASSVYSVADYRKAFVKQIMGVAPQIELPLLQILNGRENREQSILIAITQAELLPDQILQELWDLVLQNRFARNQQKINILLFGDNDWAEKTKSWLPTNNNDKPVLLTSESLPSRNMDQEIEGDLNDYIQQHREQFNERLRARANGYEIAEPIFSRWWIKLLAICTFLVCFSGILIWQYFDVTKSAAEEFAGFLFQSESSTDAISETALNNAVVDAIVERQNTEEPGLATDAAESRIDDDQQRVTDWASASSKLERQSIALPEQVIAETVSSPPTQPRQISHQAGPEANLGTKTNGLQLYESESLVDISPEQLRSLRPEPETNLAEQLVAPDIQEQMTYPTPGAEPIPQGPPIPDSVTAGTNIEPVEREITLEDSINEETIAQDLSKPSSIEEELATENTEISAANSEPPIEREITAEFVPTDASPVDQAVTEIGAVDDYPVEDIVSLEELPVAPVTLNPGPAYEFDEATLLNLSQNQYLLQISGMSSRSVLDQYLQENNLAGRIWLYKTQRYGGDWYVVLFNQSFDSLVEARASVPELPQTTRQSAPFAKSIGLINSEIEAGYPE